MQTQRINITLPNDLIRNLRQSIPVRSRSKFIAEAVSDKLSKKGSIKKDWIKSLKANKDTYKEITNDWAPLDTEGWPD